MIFSQAEYDVRMEWGEQGAKVLAPISDAIIIVDVLSFSTSVEIATCRGATVYPHRMSMEEAREFASAVGAELAEKERDAKYSLSPRSMGMIPEGLKLVMPSPNGSRLSTSTGTTPTLAGCLRNAKAIAEAAKKYGKKIAVIPAGERWPDGSLRPSFEDLIGTGAIIHHLDGVRSPEADAASSAYISVENDLENLLLGCSSGKELAERGYKQDVILAAALNVSQCVPLLQDGAFRAV